MSKEKMVQNELLQLGAQIRCRKIKSDDKNAIKKEIQKIIDKDASSISLIKQHVECEDFNCCAQHHKCLLVVKENALELIGDAPEA